jgi:hypothetical protein
MGQPSVNRGDGEIGAVFDVKKYREFGRADFNGDASTIAPVGRRRSRRAAVRQPVIADAVGTE